MSPSRRPPSAMEFVVAWCLNYDDGDGARRPDDWPKSAMTAQALCLACYYEQETTIGGPANNAYLCRQPRAHARIRFCRIWNSHDSGQFRGARGSSYAIIVSEDCRLGVSAAPTLHGCCNVRHCAPCWLDCQRVGRLLTHARRGGREG